MILVSGEIVMHLWFFISKNSGIAAKDPIQSYTTENSDSDENNLDFVPMVTCLTEMCSLGSDNAGSCELEFHG